MGVFDGINYGQIAQGAMTAGANALTGGIAGSAISALSSLFGGNSSLKDNKKMAAYQAQLEQANWEKRFNMMNEYNTPTAMRERLKAAGMNENLVYGALSPNMAASPQAGSPSGSLSKYQTAMETSVLAQQFRTIDAQIKNTEAQTDVARAEKHRIDAEAERLDLQNSITTVTFDDLVKKPHQEVLRLVKEMDIWDKNYMLQEKYYNLEKEYREKEYNLDVEWKSNQVMIGFMNAAANQQASDAAMVTAMATKDYYQKLGVVADETAKGIILNNEKLEHLVHHGMEIEDGKDDKGHPMYRFVTWDELLNGAEYASKQAGTQESLSNAKGQNSIGKILGTTGTILTTWILARYGGRIAKTPKPAKIKGFR